MASLNEKDSKKWTNAVVAIGAVLVGYLLNNVINLIGEKFDLEAKINHFNGISQGVAIAIAFISFVIVLKHDRAQKYLSEVYGELAKVIWPDKDSVFKLSFVIIISVAISSGFLVLVDLGVQKLLGLLY